MTLFLYHKIGVLHTVLVYTLRDKGVTDNKLKGLLANASYRDLKQQIGRQMDSHPSLCLIVHYIYPGLL